MRRELFLSRSARSSVVTTAPVPQPAATSQNPVPQSAAMVPCLQPGEPEPLASDISRLTDVEANRRLCELEYASGAATLRSVPYEWHLQIAEHCNMRCIMCRIGVNPGEFELHLPDNLINDINTLMPLAKTCLINGAEPFHKFRSGSLRKLLESTDHNKELSFVTTTNGLLVNETIAEIVLRRFSRIRFSVDSPVPETYESIRVRSTFARVQKNIEYLRDLKADAGQGRHDRPTLHINYLVMDRTYRDIATFVDLAHRWGVSEIRFSPMRVNFDPALASEDIFRDIDKTRELTALMVLAKQRATAHGMKIIDRTARIAQKVLREAGRGPGMAKPRRRKPPKKDLPVCRAPWGRLWVNRQGLARFCLQGRAIGNMNESSLLELYNGDVAKKIRRDFVKGDYSSCNRKNCPRGVSNLGRNTGELPENFEAERAELLNRAVFREIGAKDRDLTCNQT